MCDAEMNNSLFNYLNNMIYFIFTLIVSISFYFMKQKVITLQFRYPDFGKHRTDSLSTIRQSRMRRSSPRA